tara:strand:- start:1122 stop:1586 length:465 start_codon:yes stop_codon:yes gene_type:complete
LPVTNKIIFIFFIFLFSSSLTFSSDILVIDGDTIKIGKEKIRFSGIDAPEIHQICSHDMVDVECGKISKKILSEKIEGKKISCFSEGKDRYKRTLAECFVGDESLSSFLVRSGYAFAYRKYSEKFILDEEYAQSNSLGMWKMVFEFPWDYRKKN